MTQHTQPFGVRLGAAALARLDAYAARHDRKRAWAAARAIAAGLDALEGLPAGTSSLEASAPPSAPAGLDLDALAVALAERMGPFLTAAVADLVKAARAARGRSQRGEAGEV